MYVYVISTDIRNNPVKIGKSRCPKSRLTSLASGNPDKLHIKHLIRCESDRQASALEYELHRKLKRFHVSGEWFRPEAVGKVRKICTSYAKLMLPKHPDARMACWEVTTKAINKTYNP